MTWNYLISVVTILASPVVQGAEWHATGPFGGSAQVVAVDPSRPKVLLAGARNTILFLSEDGAESWRLLPFPRDYSGAVRAIGIFPSEQRYWVGVSSSEPTMAGVWESLDGGEHWRAIPGLSGRSVESLAIWHGESRSCAAGTRQGVWLTGDQGRTWRRISPVDRPDLEDITAIALHPSNAGTIYAGTPHLAWLTTNGGADWRTIRTGMVDDSDVFSIDVNPQKPERIFAGACSGIYHSGDGGKTWRRMPVAPGSNPRTHVVLQDPHDQNIVYAGTSSGLFRSGDGGATWHQLKTFQVNSLALDPMNPSTLYIATEYGGMWKSARHGEAAEAVNRGFTTHMITHLATSRETLYAAVSDPGTLEGVFISTDRGNEWRQAGAEPHGASLYALAATGTGTLYAAAGREVLQSKDQGATWAHLAAQPSKQPAPIGGERAAVVHTLQAGERNGRAILFAGTADGLFRWTAGNSGWDQLAVPGWQDSDVRALFTTRSGERVAVLMAGGLVLSLDSGATWRNARLPRRNLSVYDVALSCFSDDSVLLATSHGLYRSRDGESPWELQSLPAETVTAVACHPAAPDVVFAAQRGSVYRSVNGGSSWDLLPRERLNGAWIDILGVVPEVSDRVFVVARGQGVLSLDLN